MVLSSRQQNIFQQPRPSRLRSHYWVSKSLALLSPPRQDTGVFAPRGVGVGVGGEESRSVRFRSADCSRLRRRRAHPGRPSRAKKKNGRRRPRTSFSSSSLSQGPLLGFVPKCLRSGVRWTRSRRVPSAALARCKVGAARALRAVSGQLRLPREALLPSPCSPQPDSLCSVVPRIASCTPEHLFSQAVFHLWSVPKSASLNPSNIHACI